MPYLEGRFVHGDDTYLDDYYMDERWAYIDGIVDYMVSDKGRVWSAKSQTFLKLKRLDRHGHLGVCLHQNGFNYYFYIHRLMAKAFIPNPHNYPIVRHLDDDPSNNDLENLAWGTQKDNARDSIENGNAYFLTDEDREKGHELSRTPLLATDLETGETFIFRGQCEAARELNVHQANIWKVMNGQRPQTQGYRFEYLDKGGDEYGDH